MRDRSRTSLARPPSSGGLRDLEERFVAVRGVTERLSEPLSPEDCTVQSMPDASPVKWHLAHTTWFFETFVLEPGELGYRAFHPGFRILFNSYYNAVGAQYPRPERGKLSRPSLAEVRAYRQHVDAHILGLLARGAVNEMLADRIELGLHHEQQHQELLLTDVKHLLSLNPLEPAYRPLQSPPKGFPAPVDWISYPGGVVWIGHEGQSFCFDNERPRHRHFLEPFALASRLVTNGEFLEFMGDGGYGRPEFWLSEGWAAVRSGGWSAPLYWRQEADGGWRTLTLSGSRRVREDEPVCHLSLFEADAFARWAGARLPSEGEWEVAAADAIPDGNFLESDLLHPAPPPAGCERPAQLFGDLWEWTRSSYSPYPGFRPEAGALGEYNAKFMSGQLVLRGGSCATPRSHVRPTYRNFFPPHSRWQFSGLRLARDG